MDDTEIWVPVPRFGDRYEVSNLGRIRSIAAQNQWGVYRRNPPRLLAQNITPGGYALVHLKRDGECWPVAVHRLVLLAFVGEAPPEHEAGHRNGDRLDNRLANLDWITQAENCRDRDRHGRTAHGDRNGRAKVTRDDVRAIRRQRAAGAPVATLAERYGLAPVSVRDIVSRRSWRHVP